MHWQPAQWTPQEKYDILIQSLLENARTIFLNAVPQPTSYKEALRLLKDALYPRLYLKKNLGSLAKSHWKFGAKIQEHQRNFAR